MRVCRMQIHPSVTAAEADLLVILPKSSTSVRLPCKSFEMLSCEWYILHDVLICNLSGFTGCVALRHGHAQAARAGMGGAQLWCIDLQQPGEAARSSNARSAPRFAGHLQPS